MSLPRVTTLIALLGLSSLGLSDENTENLENLLHQLQSAQGSFEQIIREQDGYVLDRQTGTFALQQPRKLRWQISELDQLLVGDGKQIYLYDELFEQVTVRDWSSNPSVNPAAILLEDIDLENWAEVESSENVLSLRPHNVDSILQIDLTLEQGFPQLLSMLDSTGQTTEIRFTDVELGADLAVELFEFEIPAGAEVIYEN